MDLEMESGRWFEEAEYDLEAAKDAMASERYNWACFIFQQAAEKAIKAVYIIRGEDVERVHSIMALVKGDPARGLGGVGELTGLLECAIELDRHYIPTRYPNGVPYGKPYEFYTEKIAEECLDCAQKLIEACRKILKLT